jgi:predicted MFS family arabinose efflux permease
MVDRGISPQVATSAISAAGMALIVGRLIAGYLLDRIFAPYVALFFIFVPLVGLGLLFLPATPAVALAATICVGLGLGAEVDLIAFMIARYFGFRSFGEIYGYLFAVFTFGSGVGPFIMGLSFSKTGSYGAAIVALAAALIISAFLVLFLGPYRYANLMKS